MYYIVNAIVLKRVNVSEYDKIVNFYTLQLGKIKCLFKGVNKITAKFISFTEPASELELQIVKFKNENYGYIFKTTGAKLINFNENLRLDLKRYFFTCRILDLVDAMTLEGVKDENKFFLIRRIFEVLSFSKNYNLSYLAFVYRFLKLCGYMPRIEKCITCRLKLNDIRKIYYFDFISNGIICQNCIKNLNNNNLKISYGAIKLLNMFYKLNANDINNLLVDKNNIEEVEHLTFLYLQNYLNRNLKILDSKF